MCLDVVRAQRHRMKSGETAFYIPLEPKISIAGAGISPANCRQERPDCDQLASTHTHPFLFNRPPSSDNIANQEYRIAQDVQAPSVFDADWFKIASLRPSSRTIHARHNDKPHDLVAAGFRCPGLSGDENGHSNIEGIRRDGGEHSSERVDLIQVHTLPRLCFTTPELTHCTTRANFPSRHHEAKLCTSRHVRIATPLRPRPGNLNGDSSSHPQSYVDGYFICCGRNSTCRPGLQWRVGQSRGSQHSRSIRKLIGCFFAF